MQHATTFFCAIFKETNNLINTKDIKFQLDQINAEG